MNLAILCTITAAALLAACSAKEKPVVALEIGPLPVMERVALAANRCWFKSKDPAFAAYRLAPELNSFTGTPRILIVKRHSPESRPLLVVQAQGSPVKLEVVNNDTAFTRAYDKGEIIRSPVAHHDGNYFADDATLDRIEGEGRVAFRYATDVNGSSRGIAGLINAGGNVLGMMPHPERRIEAAHGGTDGRRLFEGLLALA